MLLQEHVAPELQGRVFGVLTMLMTSVMPLGMLVFGPLAELVRIETLLLATGAGMAVVSLAVTRKRRLVEAGVPSALG